MRRWRARCGWREALPGRVCTTARQINHRLPLPCRGCSQVALRERHTDLLNPAAHAPTRAECAHGHASPALIPYRAAHALQLDFLPRFPASSLSSDLSLRPRSPAPTCAPQCKTFARRPTGAKTTSLEPAPLPRLPASLLKFCTLIPSSLPAPPSSDVR